MSETRAGIYTASKTKHADRWRRLRAEGFPINSTWIDEAGKGESTDLSDLWIRCIREASTAAALVVYREGDDVLKGAWAEMGAALAAGVPVLAVGIEEFTIANHPSVRHFPSLAGALSEAVHLASLPPGSVITEKDYEDREQARLDGAATFSDGIEAALNAIKIRQRTFGGEPLTENEEAIVVHILKAVRALLAPAQANEVRGQPKSPKSPDAEVKAALAPFAKIGEMLSATPGHRDLYIGGMVVEQDGQNSRGSFTIKAADLHNALAALRNTGARS